MSGQLYIVATPIGNLADITLRALEVLKAVDVIAAEDTRHSRILLQHYQINTSVISLHGDNEKAKTEQLLVRIQAGESIALISDAGTPLISDPGSYFVQQARAQNIHVVPIPGACALIAALSASGLSTQSFRFIGFLPHKGRDREAGMQAIADDVATLVFYESCHRIVNFLKLAQSVFGAERYVVLARELTKHFETIRGDRLDRLYEWVQADANQQKGEYVVLVSGSDTQPDSGMVSRQQIIKVLAQHLPTKQAAKLTAEITGESQRDLYQRMLELKNQS